MLCDAMLFFSNSIICFFFIIKSDSNSILFYSALLYCILFFSDSNSNSNSILFYSVLISILFSSLLPFVSFLSYSILPMLFCFVLFYSFLF